RETTAEKVLRRLSGGPATADEILRALDRPVPEALALIGSLELEGILRREADGRYVLSQRAAARA
ncbi:MAG: PadR family transcriptional regulator, partial [Gemmatimonadetes bacterium]|nr:PadR family transcriptional regulator [Gemmatimonadota bacterium]